tara:strand:+ start:281 stop:511 length:231 start_codon:yes stop_codon:yes gene_type:complete
MKYPNKTKKEGNIFSYKILINKKGQLITEIGGLPIEDVNKVFKGYNINRIQTVIREAKNHFSKFHNKLEAELDALK